ncbi:MAG: DUF1080 domain-containing protein [Gemmataceae bacterium]
MNRWILGVVLAGVVFVAGPVAQTHAQEGWVKLFNGKNLKGWKQRNGTATYSVEDGCVVGKTMKGSPNSFLCTTKDYSDFELKFEVKVDNKLNSGVQFRSKTRGSFTGRVHGPQCEIATNGSAGWVYGEDLGTGWLSQGERHKIFKNNEWNSYKIRAVGPHIMTWLNGEKIVDFKDMRSLQKGKGKKGKSAGFMASGFIALQVHSIPAKQGPYEVRWKNIYLKDLTTSKKN